MGWKKWHGKELKPRKEEGPQADPSWGLALAAVAGLQAGGGDAGCPASKRASG